MGQTKTAVIEGVKPVKTEDKATETQGQPQGRNRKVGQDGHGKNYLEAAKKTNKSKVYTAGAAIDALKEMSYVKFDPTVELHLNMTKDIETEVKFPHKTGKTKKIEVADEKTVEKIKAGKIDFDILLATPEMMPKLVPFAKILGPKGLMPNPKAGTLIKNASEAKNFSVNTIRLKTEKKAPLIHTAVGKLSQKKEELIENIEAVLSAVGPKNIKKAYLTSTMSPSVRLEV